MEGCICFPLAENPFSYPNHLNRSCPSSQQCLQFLISTSVKAKNISKSSVGRFDKLGCNSILSLQNNMGTTHWELTIKFDVLDGVVVKISISRSAGQQTTEDTEHKSIILSLIALPAPEGHTEIYRGDSNITVITSLLNWNEFVFLFLSQNIPHICQF